MGGMLCKVQPELCFPTIPNPQGIYKPENRGVCHRHAKDKVMEVDVWLNKVSWSEHQWNSKLAQQRGTCARDAGQWNGREAKKKQKEAKENCKGRKRVISKCSFYKAHFQ